ncbi:unnamed protein product [Urochloa decumbens]|uniref:Uncharacterized protein n=1 Tax=Urochloa decumbens TaxID=240449 RepID=A0ABC9BJB0_9POAL
MDTGSRDDCGGANHHCAWTNIRRERWEGDLVVQGHIPAWLNGTYLRNGPGVWGVGGGKHGAFEHVFDGYATLVRVSIRGAHGHAAGAHRQIESDAYTSAMARGRPVLHEFSQLCPRSPGSLLDRLRSAVGLADGGAMSDNANTVVVPLGDGRRVLCLADVAKSSVLVDPETLRTIGKLRYTDWMRWWCPVQCTHPVVTRSGDELLTLLPDFARRGYLAVRMSTTGSSSEREVVGRVRCRGGPTPGWVHSFAVTERYIVVPEMPLRYSVGRMLKSEIGPLYILDWLLDSGSFMHVICRSTGNTVASVAVPPFVAFHFINAYEERGDDDGGMANAVIADCCEYYADPAIIQALALHRLRSLDTAKELFPESRVARFRIPLDGSPLGMLETVLDPDAHGQGVELSTINPAYMGREYRYLYACSIRRPCNFFNSLTKMDLVEKEAKMSWHEEGTVPSEPFFVARPGATQEDDGVVISTVTSMDGDLQSDRALEVPLLSTLRIPRLLDP